MKEDNLLFEINVVCKPAKLPIHIKISLTEPKLLSFSEVEILQASIRFL